MFKRLLLSLILVTGAVYGANDGISKFRPEVQAVVDEFCAGLKAELECSKKAYELAVGKLWHLCNSGSISYTECGAALRDLVFAEDAEKKALYWAKVRAFAWDMFNPYAYADAVKKTWQAGWGNMLNTLWTNHKSVLAGSALIATAAATGLFVAYKKGCFEQKKETENE